MADWFDNLDTEDVVDELPDDLVIDESSIDIICRDSIPCAGECSISTHLQPFLHVVFGIDASRVALLFGTPHDAL